MKKLSVALLLAPLLAIANTNAVTEDKPRADRTVNTPIPAGATVVMRHQLGSGTPGFVGFEPATHLGEGIYHAPQYMPMYPTAAVLWPRVIEVECEREGGRFVCGGYDWLPALGRGEYLYIRPTVKEPVAPTVVEKIVPVPVVKERIIERRVYVEVENKKKGE